jgi:hypothetical protein
MKMTFDNAISWLLSIAKHEGEDIPIYDTDVEAIQMGIDTIHKYQKIEQIISEWNNHCISTQVAISEIANEVIEDEND